MCFGSAPVSPNTAPRRRPFGLAMCAKRMRRSASPGAERFLFGLAVLTSFRRSQEFKHGGSQFGGLKTCPFWRQRIRKWLHK
jgi:hypothetical protein